MSSESRTSVEHGVSEVANAEHLPEVRDGDTSASSIQCMQASSDVDLEQNVGHDTTAEVRKRIKSFSREPEARPSSCYGESERQELNRAGSISGASPPNIIKVQEEPTESIFISSNLQPNRSPKRRSIHTVAENQIKADPERTSPRRYLRLNSSSSAESICQSVGSSLSSYDAEPDFFQAESESLGCSAAK